MSIGRVLFLDVIPAPIRSRSQTTASRPIEKVPVSTVHFSHDSIACRFKNGSHAYEPLSQLVRDLREGTVTVDDPSLVLDVVVHEGRRYSLRNRRLFCLKEYAKEVGADIAVSVRTWEREERLPGGSGVLELFLRSHTTRNKGRAVRIRSSSRGSEGGMVAPPS